MVTSLISVRRGRLRTSTGDSMLPAEPERMPSADELLGRLPANVMIARPDLSIGYLNPSARATLARLEPALRSSFGLGVDDILGGSAPA